MALINDKMAVIGNDIVNFIGGREVHPINVRVGGFYRLPSQAKAKALRETLLKNREFAVETIRFMAGLDFPDFEQNYEFVAMKHPNEYPYCEGRIVSSSGINIPVEAFLNEFEEIHVKHSTALHGRLKDGRTYLVGPLARVNLNFDQLPDSVKEIAKEIGFEVPCRNNFKSIIARALETLSAVDHAIEILEKYDDTPAPYIQIADKAGIGHGCSEAPRGSLYHRYTIDEAGIIQDARIVPPTAQNQKTIEQDLWHFIPPRLDLSKEELTWQCEQAIRNYDPCISCSTHFLRVEIADA